MSTPAPELKLYVATSRVHAVRPLIDQLLPQAAPCLAGAQRLMVAATFDENASCTSRVYGLWRRDELDRPEVRDGLRRWCGAEEIGVIAASGSATLSIAFKQGRRDMLYLSSPFARPLSRYVTGRLVVSPLLLGELATLRWIGFSKHGGGLADDVLNVYFSSAY
ncbi:MAG: hypothetical protein MZW92_60230 [Comamonadaceae bacterium]|nr:hypothetical protein [Comamonadaceae bacterium]